MKCTCGNDKFITTQGKTHKGLHCSECGKWIKWVGKNEVERLKLVLKIIEER